VTCSHALVGHACRRPGAVCPNLRYTWMHHRAVSPFLLRRSFWPWRCIHANPCPDLPKRRSVVTCHHTLPRAVILHIAANSLEETSCTTHIGQRVKVFRIEHLCKAEGSKGEREGIYIRIQFLYYGSESGTIGKSGRWRHIDCRCIVRGQRSIATNRTSDNEGIHSHLAQYGRLWTSPRSSLFTR
jgi:hypothetical protein